MDTPEILTKAAGVIETRGWFQGDYIPPGGDRAICPVCVLAALNVAAGFPPDGDPNAGSDVTGPAADAAGELVDWLSGLSVDTWNDAPERTKEEVTTALRECAAELSKAGA
jgi:hypothetical protein